ncbi:MAG: hypothetical protein EA384_07190 [Spirochaetaceae bacterium]|nr:MAG: hypothetical protein EA384_07190 [Spirochaetaceae bacterium]
MNENSSKTFDCVKSMRQARDKLSAEVEGMSHDQLVEWFRNHQYSDPVHQRLAERAAQKADAADRPAAGR